MGDQLSPTGNAGAAPQPGNPQPHQSGAKNGCAGCAGLVVVFVVVFWIADYAGCKWTQSQSGSSPVAVSRPTKAEWLAKVAGRYQYAQMRIIDNWRVNDSKSFMGEPDGTQSFGDHAFWYYDCSDGGIQLSMFAPNLAVGVMQGNINDY